MNSSTRREIDQACEQVLVEAGLTTPPISLDVLIDHLNLHRDYYSLEDPGFLDHVRHKMRIGVSRLIDVVRRVRLVAAWLPDSRRILVDEGLPKPKKKWAGFHESTHSILPWHREYFLGDTAQTLDPDFQEALELEANYGASTLMFGAQLFTREAKDTRPELASVHQLATRYEGSKAATLRRYVEHSHDIPMAMAVTTARWDVMLKAVSRRPRLAG